MGATGLWHGWQRGRVAGGKRARLRRRIAVLRRATQASNRIEKPPSRIKYGDEGHYGRQPPRKKPDFAPIYRDVSG